MELESSGRDVMAVSTQAVMGRRGKWEDLQVIPQLVGYEEMRLTGNTEGACCLCFSLGQMNRWW